MFHYGPIAGIASYKQYVATAGYDNQVILWDGGHHKSISMGLHDHLVNHVAFNSAGSLLVSASSDYTAKVWEVPSMKLVVTLKGHTDDIDMAVFSPNDKLVATCALDRTIRIFDLKGNCLKIFQGHTGNIISLVWGEGGKKLVSSSVDGTIREWDVDSCKRIALQ
jgi:WD40 repeat protein